MNKTKFTIIGSGYYVKIYDQNHPLYKKLKSIKDVDPRVFLLGFRSLEALDLKDETGKVYSSLFEIKPDKTFPIYCIDAFTRLEIKRENTKATKLFFKNLFRTDYLFPPSHIKNEVILKNEGLLVLEYDKGHWGATTHHCEFPLEDEIKFEIITIQELNIKCIKTIKVNDNEIILKQPDTLNFGTTAYLI
jgi:hypothetical protein